MQYINVQGSIYKNLDNNPDPKTNLIERISNLNLDRFIKEISVIPGIKFKNPYAS